MPPYPHVRSLKIQNFKGIAGLNLPLDGSLTLLAGVNGVGKTSAIEALLGAVTEVWSWLAADNEGASYRPSGDLVRYGASEGQIALELVLEQDVRSTVTIPFRAGELARRKHLQGGVLNAPYQKASPIPLVISYGQNRIGGLNSDSSRPPSETNREAALDTTPRALSDFENWFFEKESDEAREAVERGDLEYADPEVGAVQEVIRSVAGGSTVLRSGKPDGSMDRTLFLGKDGGTDIPFEALSGGEQAYFLIAVDLAGGCFWNFRAARLRKLRVSSASTRSSSICIRLGSARS